MNNSTNFQNILRITNKQILNHLDAPTLAKLRTANKELKQIVNNQSNNKIFQEVSKSIEYYLVSIALLEIVFMWFSDGLFHEYRQLYGLQFSEWNRQQMRTNVSNMIEARVTFIINFFPQKLRNQIKNLNNTNYYNITQTHIFNNLIQENTYIQKLKRSFKNVYAVELLNELILFKRLFNINIRRLSQYFPTGSNVKAIAIDFFTSNGYFMFPMMSFENKRTNANRNVMTLNNNNINTNVNNNQPQNNVQNQPQNNVQNQPQNNVQNQPNHVNNNQPQHNVQNIPLRRFSNGNVAPIVQNFMNKHKNNNKNNNKNKITGLRKLTLTKNLLKN